MCYLFGEAPHVTSPGHVYGDRQIGGKGTTLVNNQQTGLLFSHTVSGSELTSHRDRFLVGWWWRETRLVAADGE